MGRFIFRYIRGRLVKLRLPAGTPLDAGALAKSSAIKKSLKFKASAKTSLSNKRVEAVKAVREAVKEKNFNLVSNEVTVAFDPKRKLVIKKPAPKGDSFMLGMRGQMKAVLSKQRLAPETFTVKTQKQTYLVEKQIKPAMEAGVNPLKVNKARNYIERKMKKQGMEVIDLSVHNIGLNKGRFQTFDAGGTIPNFDQLDKQSKRINKFLIKLPPKKK